MGLDSLYKEAKETNTFIVGKCVVGQWAATLNGDDEAAFQTSLNDDNFSTRGLFDLYKSAGAPFGLTVLKEHRNGKCACR